MSGEKQPVRLRRVWSIVYCCFFYESHEPESGGGDGGGARLKLTLKAFLLVGLGVFLEGLPRHVLVRLRLGRDALRPAGPRSDELRAGQDRLVLVQVDLQLLYLVLAVRQTPLERPYPLLLEQQDLGEVVLQLGHVCRQLLKRDRAPRTKTPLEKKQQQEEEEETRTPRSACLSGHSWRRCSLTGRLLFPLCVATEGETGKRKRGRDLLLKSASSSERSVEQRHATVRRASGEQLMILH